MGRLLRNDERPADCTGQAARYQTSLSGRDLDTYDGEVPDSGDRAGGKVCMRDSQTVQETGSGDRGRHTCNARTLGGTLLGRGMGFSPH